MKQKLNNDFHATTRDDIMGEFGIREGKMRERRANNIVDGKNSQNCEQGIFLHNFFLITKKGLESCSLPLTCYLQRSISTPHSSEVILRLTPVHADIAFNNLVKGREKEE